MLLWGSLCHHVKREASRFIHLSSDDAGAKKLRAELMERLARAMLAGADTSPYPTALA